MTLVENALGLLQKANLDSQTLSFVSRALDSAKTHQGLAPGIRVSSMLAPSRDSIIIFNASSNSPGSDRELLEVIGELIYSKAGQVGQDVWSKKLVFSNSEVGKIFNDKLQSGAFSTFRSLVESIPTPVLRLEALHVANALIANGVSMGDAKNLDVTKWPAVEGLVNGTVPYPLLPLVSAYFDPSVWSSFPKAFAAYVKGELVCPCQDVTLKLHESLNSVLELCHE